MRTYKLCLSILVLLAHGNCCLAQSSWKALPAAPSIEPYGRHEDLCFVNPSVGWIVNLRGKIYKTTDGGNSWVKQFDDGRTRFRSVGFADSVRGWAGTIDSSLLYQTTNGGSTWTRVQNIPQPKPRGICGISVVDDSVVYACGFNNSPAHVIKSTDGGTTWSSMDMKAYASALIGCYFFSRDSGFVVGGIGGNRSSSNIRAVVLFTGDGGRTWQTRHTTHRTREWCWKIFFRSRNIGYASIESAKDSLYFLATTDGGMTWEDKFAMKAYERIEGIGFVGTTGWLGSWGVSFETLDAGATWRVVDFGTVINRFQMFSDTLGYAVGKTVYKYSNDKTSGGN